MIIGVSANTAAHNLYKKEAVAGNLQADGVAGGPGTPNGAVNVDECLSGNFTRLFMPCRACGLSHSPLMRCDVFARLSAPVVNASNAVVNIESVVNKEPGVVVNAGCRQVAWQKSNRTRYNEKMRDYMKRYRALKKSAPIES